MGVDLVGFGKCDAVDADAAVGCIGRDASDKGTGMIEEVGGLVSADGSADAGGTFIVDVCPIDKHTHRRLNRG